MPASFCIYFVSMRAFADSSLDNFAVHLWFSGRIQSMAPPCSTRCEGRTSLQDCGPRLHGIVTSLCDGYVLQDRQIQEKNATPFEFRFLRFLCKRSVVRFCFAGNSALELRGSWHRELNSQAWITPRTLCCCPMLGVLAAKCNKQLFKQLFKQLSRHVKTCQDCHCLI